MTTKRLLPALVLLALLAAACGRDDTSATTATGTDPTTTRSDSAGGRGWLEGDDLAWFVEFDDSAEAGLAITESAAVGAPVELADEPADEPASDEARSTVTTADSAEPIVVDQSPLRAGSIDDGADFEAYLAYREAILVAGVPVRPLDVDDPTVIVVTGDNGLPVLDAAVSISRRGDNTNLTTVLRTTADGTTRFLPDADPAAATGQSSGSDGPWDVVVEVGDVTASASFSRGDDRVELTVDTPGGFDGSVPVDVHFLLDATGSMGDEIDRLRDNMATVAQRIDALPARPDVRFGMTVYRDEGDVFVTRTFDLTDDLAAFLDALDDVVADGGGDYAEALDEALADALELPAWRRDGAVELIVLIADAPPQVGRTVETPYTAAALDALERGVKVLPVAASGTDDQAEYVFRELAFVTGGRFVFLSYGVDGTATGTGTDIGPDDYDELPLDELVVRLVEDEILALTGGDPAPPTTTTTTTVVPTTTQQ